MTTAIEMRDITMSFGTNEVLKGIDLAIEPGKVTALLGANGAGKSTLIKVLSGVYNGYGGTVLIDGAAVDIDHPTTFMGTDGIEVAQQDAIPALLGLAQVAQDLFYEEFSPSIGVGG